jgi:PIN domain nuclease of toxin-antitoxin system
MEASMMYFLDTNAVIFLYQGETEKFSEKGRNIIENNDLFVSPIVHLELQYLYEVGRLKKTSSDICQALYREIGLQSVSLPINVLVASAIEESWTRDPFDRLITSHAKVEKAHLLTRDQTILKNYSKAIW